MLSSISYLLSNHMRRFSGTIQINPFTFNFNTGFIHAPESSVVDREENNVESNGFPDSERL
jgi:hypothetical protein